MKAPPERKAPGAGEQTGRQLTTRARYHALDLLQYRNVWGRWEREAARLFRDFWRSGDQRHLRAFFTQVAGMWVYAKRARYE